MTEHIKIENSDGILSLTMARPDKKNALTNAMYGALADAIQGAETDASVRVVLIRGEGDMFTAGNDVGEFAAIATGGAPGERHVSRFLEALARSSRPLVARPRHPSSGASHSRTAPAAVAACEKSTSIVSALRNPIPPEACANGYARMSR